MIMINLWCYFRGNTSKIAKNCASDLIVSQTGCQAHKNKWKIDGFEILRCLGLPVVDDDASRTLKPVEACHRPYSVNSPRPTNMDPSEAPVNGN